jgi:hypothetical protein
MIHAEVILGLIVPMTLIMIAVGVSIFGREDFGSERAYGTAQKVSIQADR